MKKISCSIIIASLIILLVAIGSVCAVSDSDLISDEDDFNGDGEDIELDDDGDSGDDDSEDLDDENDSEEDDYEDDDSDDLDDEEDEEEDDSEDLDDEDEDETGGYDGEFDGEAFALSASADFDGAKGMGMGAESNLNSDSQGDVPLSPQTGNPIVVLLFSLLFLIVIPLRNR